MKILGVIPARGGSKRLKDKNIKSLASKPLIQYTIEAALASTLLSKVIVSTDSQMIADMSKKMGAEVPFLRPEELAGDLSGSFEVLEHALDFFKKKGELFDMIVMLQPTSPLRIAEDIDEAIKSIIDNDFLAVVSVCKTEHSPLWMNTLPQNQSMKDFLSHKELKHTRSQDLPDYYRLNGAVYVANTPYYRENKGFFGEKTKAYIMPQDRSVDIDNELDFMQVESLLKMRD